jgi:hypothetical protein
MGNKCVVENHNQRQVAAFSTYLKELRTIIHEPNINRAVVDNHSKLHSLLNGKASTFLQQTVPIAIRKDSGIFFTRHDLAYQVASKISHLLSLGRKVVDPACGAGDLLLACANHLPMGTTLEETISIWSDLIVGYDLYEEFVDAAKLRLGILAAIKCNDTRNIENILTQNGIFPGLRVGNLLALNTMGEHTDCIVVNPPFGNCIAPGDCEWAGGKVQKAGVFFEIIMNATRNGQNIVAILPDVLRSGSRYENWRKIISGLSSSISIELKGRFDKEVDVDVFLLQAIRGRGTRQIDWINSNIKMKRRNGSVSDHFDVHVGPVVPYRDPREGPKHPYIHARTALGWATLNNIKDERQYKGSLFKPPFVVVHRTSSPSDRNRCVGTIVTGNRKVAVENHLIVLCPKDKSLQRCRELIEIFRCPRTNEWLNKRICCRHLTVSAVKELPWWRL